jgi:DNA-binding PadR family transcriptional regulator
MSISHTILGVLMDAPTHGYSIKKTLLETLSSELAVNDGQLYPALARLEGRGWIQKEVVEQRRSPNKHRYRLTTEGRSEFLRWLESPDAQGTQAPLDFFWRNDFLQKTSFLGHLEPGAVRTLVRGKLEEVSRCLRELERSLEKLGAHDADPYRRMVVDYGIRYQRMRREWLKELLVRSGERAGERPAALAAGTA